MVWPPPPPPLPKPSAREDHWLRLQRRWQVARLRRLVGGCLSHTGRRARSCVPDHSPLRRLWM
eukprot:4272752-Prymnesium_polylepis.2